MAKKLSNTTAIEESAKDWIGLQQLALHIFLSSGREEIVQMLEEEDFPDSRFKKLFIAFRDHWRLFRNTDVFEIHHALAGQAWYEEIGGVHYMLQTLLLRDAGVWHRGAIERLVEMIKELRAGRELGALQAILEDAAPGQIGEVLHRLKERARKAEELLPRSTNLSIKNMGNVLKNRKIPKIPTGFSRMDEALSGGMANGTLFVLAARPGVGKTTLALNIAARVAEKKKKVLFVSLEMTREEIAERFMAAYSDCTTEEARKNIDTLLPFVDGDILIDDATRTLDGLKTIVSRNADCDLFVVDYLQLLSATGSDGREVSRIQEISKMTREIKILARDMDKPIVLLSQMSRTIERDRWNREPVLSDLRDSGTIEQDADYVTFIWNKNAKEQEKKESDIDAFHEVKDDDKPIEQDIRWILRKNRFGAPNKIFSMDFNGPHYLFTHRPLGQKKNPAQASAF